MSKAMQKGLILMTGSVRGDVALARRAEAAGFDAALSIEFFNRNGFIVPAAIAQATDRIRVGTGIVNAFTRSPLLHASAAMDLDELSGGRMILGLGSATRRMNEDWYGVPFSRPAARMTELVRVLRAAFAAQGGGGLRFEGEFWDLKVPLYARPGAARESVPIWVAAVNRKMIRAAGRVGDGLVGHPIATRRWHREVTLPGLRAAEAEAGRESGSCVLAPYVVCVIAESREQALREAKGQIGFYYTTALYHSILDLHGLREIGDACRAAFRKLDMKGLADAVPDALVDEIAIACTPDEARDRLAQWDDLTLNPLFYPPSMGLKPERVREISDAIVDVFGENA